MNLLPKQYRDALYREMLSRFFFVAAGVVSLWIAAFFFLAHGITLYLGVQIPALQERLILERNTEQTIVAKQVEAQLDRLNETLIEIDRVRKKNMLNFPEILRRIGVVVPAGATLSVINYQDNTVAMSGIADRRAQVLTIKERLSKEPLFADVTSPISNIVKEVDVEFSFTFTVKETAE